jgi:hypothetical protein
MLYGCSTLGTNDTYRLCLSTPCTYIHAKTRQIRHFYSTVIGNIFWSKGVGLFTFRAGRMSLYACWILLGWEYL